MLNTSNKVEVPMPIPVFFSDALVAPLQGFSPSPAKPAWVVQALLDCNLPVDVRAPAPASLEDLFRAHDRDYIEGVLAGRLRNGHGTTDPDFAATLRFSSGAMLGAARAASSEVPAAALVSGFHHAGWNHGGGYCTFNGLMVAALAVLADGSVPRVAIVDADHHYGDGTQDILDRLQPGLRGRIFHESFGGRFHSGSQAKAYLERMAVLRLDLETFGPGLILYQAGADPHVQDPLGGILSTQQMRTRDRLMLETARDLGIPLAWNLAGGYQKNRAAITALHLQTFEEAECVYGIADSRLEATGSEA
jgi:acetoin utilization deacetylase AcuC-like enzyme